MTGFWLSTEDGHVALKLKQMAQQMKIRMAEVDSILMWSSEQPDVQFGIETDPANNSNRYCKGFWPMDKVDLNKYEEFVLSVTSEESNPK